MKKAPIHFILMLVFLAAAAILVGAWVKAADARLQESIANPKEKPQVATANVSDEGYCNSRLRPILRRVLTSCGLVKDGQQGGRGCQPVAAKSVAAMNGDDFNALFKPLAQRAAIIQFDADKADLDEQALQLISKTFANKLGASYFLVVSRASPDGSVARNRELSEKRGKAVLDYLSNTFKDPELANEVGLLWLGDEYAQLDQEFCSWTRNRMDGPCTTTELNRSAFIAWVDCRL